MGVSQGPLHDDFFMHPIVQPNGRLNAKFQTPAKPAFRDRNQQFWNFKLRNAEGWHRPLFSN